MDLNVFWTRGLVLCCLLIGSTMVKTLEGTAILSLKFRTFSNYGGHKLSGMCCDGPGRKTCSSKCDHSFEVCVSSERKESLRGQCPFGQVVTGPIVDQNYIQFEEKMGQKDNPLVFSIESWPASRGLQTPKIFLSVDIVDVDSDDVNNENEDEDDADDNVSRLERTVFIPPNNITKTILLQDRVQLSLDVSGYCAPHYYGLECDVYCHALLEDTSRYSCDEKGRKLCYAGWAGQECDENIDECASSPCHHEGTCIDLVNGYTCKCTHQYTGYTCKEDVDECATETQLCFNGTCVNDIGSYRCDCNAGFTGAKCLQNINECLSSPCLHGGSCSESDTHGEFHCTCPDNFTGQLCEKNVDECISPVLNQPICHHNGTCVDTVGDFYCNCPPAWTGTFCQENVDECAISKVINEPICQNGGRCVDTLGGFSCECSPFWTGELCQENVDECTKNTNSPCSSIGTESCRNVDEGFECACLEGWTGVLCDVDVDECEFVEGPCSNRGMCTNIMGSYECECKPGWRGLNCESDVNECDSIICENGGTCMNSFGGFSCRCSEFWNGEMCNEDVDECASGICSTNSTKSCHNFPGGFGCVCNQGWNGITCSEDVDECSENSDICFQEALNTIDDVNQPENISKEYDKENHTTNNVRFRQQSMGDNRNNTTHQATSTELPPVSSNRTAGGNFVCSNLMPGYSCSCAVGWTGLKCDTLIEREYDVIDLPLDVLTSSSSQSSSSDASMTIIVVMVIVGILLMVCLIGFIYRRRHGRKKLKISNPVMYVNGAYVGDRGSRTSPTNGFQNGTSLTTVEIPHMYISGDADLADGNNSELTVVQEGPRSESPSPGTVDGHNYEIPDDVIEQVDEMNPEHLSDDPDDVTSHSAIEGTPPTPVVVERSRLHDEVPDYATVVVENKGVVPRMAAAFEGDGDGEDVIYVSRMDLVLSKSQSIQNESQYEHLPYIDAEVVIKQD